MPIQVKDATGQIVSIATPDEVSAATIAALGQLLTALQAQATAAQAQPVSGSVSVSNLPATQPVSAAALPLPAGAATAAAQSTGNTSLASILSALQGQLAVAVQSFPADYPDTALLAKLEQVRALLAGTLAVSAAALPLPAGAASETTLAALLDALQAEDTPAASGSLGLPMLAMRADSDAATADDGDWTTPKLDEEGRLKVATKPASIVPVVGVANTVAATVVCDVRRASNVVFHVKNIGSVTLAAGTFVFEASIDSSNGTDGTWFGVQAVRSNANTIETSIALTGITAGSGNAASWEASVNGYAWFRLRCTVAVTASASAQWSIQRGSYATEPIPAAQVSGTQAVSGTVTANQGTLVAPTASNINSAASTNATSVKASAGTLYSVTASNTGAAVAYVKLYTKASAPTVGTDVPVLTIPIPAGGAANLPFGTTGHRFATGIALAITGAAADSDTTAVAAAQVKVAVAYI